MKPNIRFNGFNDEWKEKKLGEITEIIMGQSPHSVNYTDNPQDHILVQGNADMKNGRVVPRVWTKEVTKMVDANYLILGVRAPVGVVGKTDYPVVVGRGVAAIKGNDFLYQYLQRLQEIGYWNRMSTGSTFDSINSQDVKDAKIQLPTLPEQQKIGSLFSKYDAIIALREQKLEELNALKKGMLQQMFPKNGAKVPELRFKGFTDDWEEKKLGELSQDTFGGGTPKTSVTEYWNGEIPWIQSSDLSSDHLFGVLPKKHITENAVKNSATKLIPKNSIAIVTRVGVGKLAFMSYEFTSSQDFLSLSNLQVDCNFGMFSIYKMLQRELNNIQGTSIKGITKADLLDKEVIVPVEFEEQQKIGQLFKDLDTRILNEQSKIEQLKAQKQGLLQRML